MKSTIRVQQEAMYHSHCHTPIGAQQYTQIDYGILKITKHALNPKMSILTELRLNNTEEETQGMSKWYSHGSEKIPVSVPWSWFLLPTIFF